ncbi:hypothetical protein TcYC6_0086440 [Trypanosoma cruzi]|nr:hypothetical protein TcYC6_0086440 [Trypanosoma cruzi]
MQFMTANLIRGWFQRMEHVRKYLLGVALIIGEERRHDIVALCVFRGRGMPAIVEDVEDTELFDWEEVADVAAQRERITDYLCCKGPTIPRPVLEGRVLRRAWRAGEGLRRENNGNSDCGGVRNGARARSTPFFFVFVVERRPPNCC